MPDTVQTVNMPSETKPELPPATSDGQPTAPASIDGVAIPSEIPVVIYGGEHNQRALADVFRAVRNFRVAWLLAWQDIVQRYRRSTLGPFWLTISRAILIAAIAAIFGPIFGRQQAEFLPFLASGMILWSFISTSLGDGCTAFTSSESLIKQLPLPLFTHILRSSIRNSIILAHDLLILPVVFWWYSVAPGWDILLAIPGFAILSLALISASLMLGILCTRYRDMPQMVSSVLRVSFYVTPVMWLPDLLGTGPRSLILTFNPFYHLLEVVRTPFLNGAPPGLSWLVGISMALASSVAALALFRKKQKRLVFWL